MPYTHTLVNYIGKFSQVSVGEDREMVNAKEKATFGCRDSVFAEGSGLARGGRTDSKPDCPSTGHQRDDFSSLAQSGPNPGSFICPRPPYPATGGSPEQSRACVS